MSLAATIEARARAAHRASDASLAVAWRAADRGDHATAAVWHHLSWLQHRACLRALVHPARPARLVLL